MLAQQRGALIFVTPMILVTIALLSVMALDGARIYGVRNDLQNQANAAATAGAEAAQACGGTNVSLETMKSRALAAAQAQGFSGGLEDLNVQFGVLADNPAAPGELAFQSVDDIAASNTVYVSLSQDEAISRLLPESVLGSVTLSATAAARKEVQAVIGMAGSTAGVNGGLVGGLLGGVFGDPSYSLDPTSLSSLEDTFVEIDELLAELGVDTVEDMLPLTADNLAAALREVAGNATPAGELLDDLAGASGISGLEIADIVAVVEGAEVPEDSEVELYGLVTTLVLNVAREQQLLNGAPVTLSNLGAAGLPLISAIDEDSLTLNLYVNRAPKYLLDARARKDMDGNWASEFYAPDISLELTVAAEILPLNLLGLVEFELASLTIPLAIDAGGGTGTLTSALCARGVDNEVEFGLDLDRQVLELVTGSIDPATGDVLPEPIDTEVGKVSLLLGLATVDPILNLEAELEGSIPGSSEEVILDPKYALYCSPIEGCDRLDHHDPGGSLSGLDLDLTILDLSLLQTSLGGVDITGLATAVEPLITDLLFDVTDNLTEDVIGPLLQALGVGVGGISITVSRAEQDQFVQLVEDVDVIN
ncbi:MAG: hypothetical protein R3175_04465 [Marinobacter sp.]|uniref:hypothetical protein n=1 Tax=Marinobacter sp. TaxID=50741 RepID=UPI00299DC2B3|nr:hypothetical protein [Marinobacter sp.]MDX1755294.1 hypothetical protein [Marinobacter sp.]